MDRWQSIMLGILLIGAVALGLPALSRSTNCGGNSAALSDCKNIATFVGLYCLDHDEGFNLERLTDGELGDLRRICDDHWISSASFFLRRGDVQFGSEEILVVCDRPYTNVPRRWLGQSPATHAVGYADGSTGLMNLDEFAELDLRSFQKIE